MIRFQLWSEGGSAELPLGCAATALCLLLLAPAAMAYPNYDNKVSPIGSGAGCVDCHTGFQGGNQALHTQHRALANQNCNLCHPSGGGSTPVETYWSGAVDGRGCAGCHGRDYGETSPNSGEAKSSAYGLRLVHDAAGVPQCLGCHSGGSLGHPFPLPAVLGEDILPAYYMGATALTDPCSSVQEDLPFDVDSVGLDNDGDGDPDGADSDCVVAGTPTATATATPTATATVPFACGATPAAGCVAPEKAVLLVKEKKPGKEKLKVVLKKLQSAVLPTDFGNPVFGTTAYKICLYDGTDQLAGEYTVDQAGAFCDGKSCWSSKSKGYKYKDKALTADGMLKMVLFGGDPSKGKVVVVGKNKESTMPLGTAAALQGETSATVQLLSSDASCFGGTLSTVIKAESDLFKAKAP